MFQEFIQQIKNISLFIKQRTWNEDENVFPNCKGVLLISEEHVPLK